MARVRLLVFALDLFLLGRIGLARCRRGLIGAAQMAAQAGFALHPVLALELVRDLRLNDHVRLDAGRLDRASARRVVPRRRQARMVPLGPSGMIVCTEPLPNERVPTIVARLWSCSAPATISEAEAEPPLTSTTIGLAVGHVARTGVVAVDVFRLAAAGRHDLAAVEERIETRID